MKIQCVLIREGGTVADLDGIKYHFEPLADGAHVAEIEREAHIDRFLSIPEGYKIYHGKLLPEGRPEVIALPPRAIVPSDTPSQVEDLHALLGSSVHLPSYDIGGVTYQLSDIVRKGFEASNLTADEWNSLEEEDLHARLDIVLDDLATAAETAEAATAKTPAAEPDLDELKALYAAKFGKPPHYRMKADTITAALAED